MIKRILVVLGGSRFMDSVITSATNLARIHGATLRGCAIVDENLVDPGESVPIGGGGAAKDAREQRVDLVRTGALEAMHRFQEQCDKAGVSYTSEVLEGDCVEVLREAWRYQDIGLIGLREIFDYGVVTQDPEIVVRLINEGVRPLIAVDSRPTEMKRVLVAFNGSFECCKALKQWTLLHSNEDVAVRIVTVGEDCTDDDLEAARNYVADHGVASVETSRLEGDVVPALLDDARSWGADLMIAGSTGRSWISRMMIGDTARELVEKSDIAVFMLH